MNFNNNIQSVFVYNKIDSRYFDLNSCYKEVKLIQKKIQDVKSRNPIMNHEPIFMHNQRKGGENR